MRVSAAIRGDLAEMMKAERRKGEAATFAGVDQATQGLRLDLRKQITGAGMGQRLANTWRSKTYPPDRQSFKPGGSVWSKAPKIVSVFATGATIRAKNRRFLAVPLPAAGKRSRGAKLTPAGWPGATWARAALRGPSQATGWPRRRRMRCSAAC